MKNKKLLTKALISGSLTGCIIPLVTLGSCSSNVTNTSSVGLSKTTKQDDNAAYCTITFDDLGGKAIITGAKVVPIQPGKPIGSIKFPIATKEGSRFQWWCTDLTKPEETQISLGKIVTNNMTLYPYFDTEIKIKNCVGITAIETTKLWLDVADEENAPNLQYSKEFAKKDSWHDVPTEETEALEIKPGENVFLVGDNPEGFNIQNKYSNIRFSDTGAVNLVGNIMGLVDGGADTDEEGDITVIPSTHCFANLFAGNKAIKYVSDKFLPATELTDYCYNLMFDGCTLMKLAPTLPATTLKTGCYMGMFQNCDSLGMVNLKYEGAFNNEYFNDWLSNVDSKGQLIYGGTASSAAGFIPSTWSVIKPETSETIKVVCTDNEAQAEGYKFAAGHSYHFQAQHPDGGLCKNISWLSTNTNVASVNPDTGVVTGIRANKPGETCEIVAYSKFDKDVKNSKPIIVRELDAENRCMTFRNLDATYPTDFYFDFIGAGDAPTFEYSRNGTVWHKLWIGQPIKISPNEKVYIKGDNKEGLNGKLDGGYGNQSQTRFFFMPDGTNTQLGLIEVGGSIMGLVDDGRGEMSTVPSTYCFNNLFKNVTAIQKVTRNFLKYATGLTIGCFESLFAFDVAKITETNYSALIQIPALFVTNLSEAAGCYESMYSGCTSLTKNLTLNEAGTAYDDDSKYLSNATTLGDYCYEHMFYNCSKLETAPALPATTATEGCYYATFQACTSLKTKQIGAIAFNVPTDYSCFQTYAMNDGTSDKFYTSSSGRSKVFKFTDISADNCVTYMINVRTDPSEGETYYA